ncbi:DUF7560 family zinc ribbon protein [Halorussus salinisoli]|uniref:DUF7560 family zinc ribbon protein n=1 Tax=Halorussus salinisoli TaxID=2558242 RepID=UPI0010C22675|nr:hypothetical protein [Halorussus salinisoli]
MTLQSEGVDLGRSVVSKVEMAQKYRFACPTCEERVIVDRDVRDKLLTQGCVVCSASVYPNCFEPV